MDRIQSALQVASRRQDLVIVGFILMVIALMILPLPTWLMDLAIAVNIMIALLFIILAVYLKDPLEFSTLPSAMLIATLIRIAITIATSRLILLQADAGEIVQSFGSFVIAGNVVVGLVIFAIIAIAQFVVITRGAERVAEVAARFALDALPGKQMSIDSDLRAGDIDRAEARRRRMKLEHESQYYGAMDGAMKFVKGDAIVSMIIIFVNLVGGLLVGTLMQGMDVGTAFATYALLTVGDGLASQIPALLVAVAGGIVVTRVTTETSDNLGADMARELVSSAQSLAIVAAALLAMALVPGFPSLTFLALGGITAAGAAAIWMFDKRRRQERDEADAEQSRAQEAAQDPANLPVSRPGEAFTLRLAPDVMAGLERTRFNETANAEMAAIRHKLGLTLPIAGIVEDGNLANNAVEFDAAGAAAWRGTVQPDGRFEVPQNTGEPASGSYDTVMPGVGVGAWREGEAATAETADDGDAALALTPSEVLAKVTVFNIGRWAHHAFGLQAADEWLNGLAAAGHDGLVQQVRQSVSVSRIADIVRHLLAEGVSLAHARLVLEAILDLAPRLEDTKLIADHVRLALARPLSAQHASGDRTISAIVIELDLEEHLRGAVIEGPTGNRLSLEFDAADALETALRAWQEPAWRTDRPLVVITGFEVRRTVWQFAVSRNIPVSVLAFEEIAPEYQIVPVGALNMSALQQPACMRQNRPEQQRSRIKNDARKISHMRGEGDTPRAELTVYDVHTQST